METFLTFVIGFILGWLALRILVIYRLMGVMKAINEPEKAPDIKIVKLVFTKIDDRIYAYDASNENFMAHGSTKEEIVESLQKRFPKTHFTANVGNLKEVGL